MASGEHRREGTLGRLEQARLLAFAFCNADALLEVDADGIIVYANGATQHIWGATADALLGRTLPEITAPTDRHLLQALMERARAGDRFRDVILRVQAEAGEHTAAFNGYAVPDLGDHCYLTARTVQIDSGAASASGRAGANGLLGRESFVEAIQHHFTEVGAGVHQGELTFISMAGLPELQGRLSPAAWDVLQRQVGSFLRALSIEGDSAAQLGPDRFGILHARDVDLRALQTHLGDFTRQADPAMEGCKIAAETIHPDQIEMTGPDLARAVVYTIQKFAGTDDDPAATLSRDLSSELRDAARRTRFLKKTVAGGHFDVAYQPIVSLEDGAVHHFEALLRLPEYPSDISPFDFIRFAEDVGLIANFDLAMCRKTMERLKSRLEREAILPVAVNISGRSIDSAPFVKQLKKLLGQYPQVHGHILFEITESARIGNLERANAIIQEFRQAGFGVCLDDFGAGEAAFEYLHVFEVDYVKIDSRYVTHAAGNPKDRAFLTAMSGLCHDLGISTIAEGIENDSIVDFLRECGVSYGQGYMFDRPDVAADLTGRRVSKNLKRKGAVETWM